MKKKISLVLALIISLSLAGCGEKAQKADDKKPADLSRPANVSEETKEESNAEEVVIEKDIKEEAVTEKDTSEDKAEEIVQNEEKTDTEASTNEGVIKTVDLKAVRDDILNSCGITDSMMLETDALTRLYSIDASKVKQSASFVTMSGTFPHEIIMVEAIDESAATEIDSLLQSRLSEVMVQSKSYDAKNYALAQKCKVSRKGNYISLFLSPEFEKMTSVYSGYIK